MKGQATKQETSTSLRTHFENTAFLISTAPRPNSRLASRVRTSTPTPINTIALDLIFCWNPRHETMTHTPIHDYHRKSTDGRATLTLNCEPNENVPEIMANFRAHVKTNSMYDCTDIRIDLRWLEHLPQIFGKRPKTFVITAVQTVNPTPDPKILG